MGRGGSGSPRAGRHSQTATPTGGFPHVHPTNRQAGLDRPLVEQPRDPPRLGWIEQVRAREVGEDLDQDADRLHPSISRHTPDIRGRTIGIVGRP